MHARTHAGTCMIMCSLCLLLMSESDTAVFNRKSSGNRLSRYIQLFQEDAEMDPSQISSVIPPVCRLSSSLCLLDWAQPPCGGTSSIRYGVRGSLFLVGPPKMSITEAPPWSWRACLWAPKRGTRICSQSASAHRRHQRESLWCCMNHTIDSLIVLIQL